jgi:hypothetical protein
MSLISAGSISLDSTFKYYIKIVEDLFTDSEESHTALTVSFYTIYKGVEHSSLLLQVENER